MKNYEIEDIIANNEVVGYYKGKAIVKNDWGFLFFIEIPEEFVTIGEVIATHELTEIEALPLDEFNEIRRVFE